MKNENDSTDGEIKNDADALLRWCLTYLHVLHYAVNDSEATIKREGDLVHVDLHFSVKRLRP